MPYIQKQLFQVWWYTFHPVLERLRQEDLEFQANLDPDSKPRPNKRVIWYFSVNR